MDKSFSSDDCEVIDGENYCYVLYVTAVNGAMYRLPNTGGSGFAYIPIVLGILGAAMYSSIKKTDDRKDNIHKLRYEVCRRCHKNAPVSVKHAFLAAAECA